MKCINKAYYLFSMLIATALFGGCSNTNQNATDPIVPAIQRKNPSAPSAATSIATSSYHPAEIYVTFRRKSGSSELTVPLSPKSINEHHISLTLDIDASKNLAELTPTLSSRSGDLNRYRFEYVFPKNGKTPRRLSKEVDFNGRDTVTVFDFETHTIVIRPLRKEKVTTTGSAASKSGSV